MFNVTLRRKTSRDEPEKPFWISFSDMMTALMVLFLLVMSVALLAVTRTVTDQERLNRERDIAVNKLIDQVRYATRTFGVTVSDHGVVDFHDRAHFEEDSSDLNERQAALLRRVVRQVLSVASEPLGRQWFKEIQVDGYTDRNGTYLYNLNLSLERSQRVLCVLMDENKTGDSILSAPQLAEIRKLFVVGGYSSNSSLKTEELSRRIELRLEFLDLRRDGTSDTAVSHSQIGSCAI